MNNFDKEKYQRDYQKSSRKDSLKSGSESLRNKQVKKNHRKPGQKTSELSKVEERLVNTTSKDIFDDPRVNKERRKQQQPEQVPETGCRRKYNRRSQRLRIGFWWMRRGYFDRY